MVDPTCVENRKLFREKFFRDGKIHPGKAREPGGGDGDSVWWPVVRLTGKRRPEDGRSTGRTGERDRTGFDGRAIPEIEKDTHARLAERSSVISSE